MFRQPAVSITPVPQFGNSSAGFRVRHREYLGDIRASSVAGQFSITQYPVNPGLYSTFPWLCSIASQYDKWQPNGIVVCLNSLSSTYSGTSSLGTVAIATDYDVLDTPYVNKIEMENSQFATSGNSSQSLLHPIECKTSLRSERLYKTRFGGISTTDNLRFYDHCNVYVATSGCTANQVVAELWISYDITLYYPQLNGGLLGRTLLTSYASGTGCTTASPYGTLTFSSSSNFVVTPNLTDLTFPANLTGGTFYVALVWTGTTSSPTSNTPVYTSGCSAGPAIAGGNSYIGTTGGVNTSSYMFTVALSGNYNTVQTVTLPAALTLAGSTTLRLIVYQINSVVSSFT